MIRAKFHCSTVTDNVNSRWAQKEDSTWYDTGEKTKTAEQVTMNPVYATEGPNKVWSESTPSGAIQLYITNKAAWGKFVAGNEYFVDFTEAPKEQ